MNTVFNNHHLSSIQVQDTMRVLQRHFSREISRCDPEAPYIKEFLNSLNAIVHSVVCKTVKRDGISIPRLPCWLGRPFFSGLG